MKKLLLIALATGFCVGTSTVSFAQKGFWQRLETKTVNSSNPKTKLPKAFSILKLDQEGIKAALKRAGTTYASGIDLTLPTPEGTFKTFRIWNTPVLASGIQAQFPDIQTYTGSYLDDASQTLKLTTGEMGIFIRSFAFDMDEVFAIEPYSFSADGYYTLSSAKDFYSSYNESPCGSVEKTTGLTEGEAGSINPTRNQIVERVLGATRRTYRLAISCTGEYALAVSGSPNPTVSQILNIVAATVNNANGLWERELSISTQIVNSNTAILYVDPSVDPFNDDGDHPAMLDENQANIDVFIGAGNYDLGHVFSESGGGLAQLASVCSAGGKAKAQSGAAGGPNDIGTFCHEAGHQFGAGHTFTSKSGGCDGNGMATSSVEPGSGTTIMSYNGACGADNTPLLTTPLTDYYNQFNLKQMTQVFTSSGMCGSTALGQAPVNLPDMNANFIIPANTPFELISNEAINTVASNSAPLYCWEQNDLGPIDMVEANGASATSGPVFMSLPPVAKLQREFPRYETLAANKYSASGERLPNVARKMKFKVTARSIAQDGWGTNNTIEGDVNIKVVPSSLGNFRVNNPDSSSWTPGQKYKIKWTQGNTLKPEDSIMAGFVNIYLSGDAGMSFPVILATNVPNTGEFEITAPNVNTTMARLKVKAVGNIFFDVSKNNFKINGTGTIGVKENDFSKNIQLFPNPTSHNLNIKNNAYDGQSLNVSIVNILGQKVWEGSMLAEKTIDVSAFAKGTYMVYLRNDKSAAYGVQKVIIK
ncbi:MAG TPA: zinc-dependent metalloprotease [Edaphocola sp.]|nr:zinc-dependent metalloprotease [Edaphocola sp.]